MNLGEDLGPIRIHGKAEPGLSINFSPQFRWDYTQFETKANANGEYELGGLKAGRYRVLMYGSSATGFMSRHEREIVVDNDGQQIDLLPKPIGKSTSKTTADSKAKN